VEKIRERFGHAYLQLEVNMSEEDFQPLIDAALRARCSRCAFSKFWLGLRSKLKTEKSYGCNIEMPAMV